jgi:ATP-dependent Clp protease protease subunit
MTLTNHANNLPQNVSIPYVIQKTAGGERSFDIFSRLLEERIVMLDSEINDQVASVVCAQLLYLESKGDDDIIMYINSPGGSISAGLAIHDTMRYIKPDVATACMGMAASMGAFLLSAGAESKRFALPYSEIMIHQPLTSGMSGQSTDIQIHAKHLERTRTRLETLMAQYTGKTLEEIHDACERDNYLIAEEALEFGLIDSILTARK